VNVRPDDRVAINEVLAKHGHYTDDGAFERLHEVFTDDIVCDLSEFGLGEVTGREALRTAALKTGDRNPLGHHITNVVLSAVSDDEVHARTKGFGVNADGTCGTVTYDDVIRRTEQGWRIARRRISTRSVPIGGRHLTAG
jgi:3-phenylpropionate/cinnamic acid dioxygenase small subunit